MPPHQAADASGVLTTVLQLSQAVGVAVLGSVFLSVDAGGARGPEGSGHAVAVTLGLAAVSLALAVAAAVPLGRTVRAAVGGIR